jgi:hypothetical protein
MTPKIFVLIQFQPRTRYHSPGPPLNTWSKVHQHMHSMHLGDAPCPIPIAYSQKGQSSVFSNISSSKFSRQSLSISTSFNMPGTPVKLRLPGLVKYFHLVQVLISGVFCHSGGDEKSVGMGNRQKPQPVSPKFLVYASNEFESRALSVNK